MVPGDATQRSVAGCGSLLGECACDPENVAGSDLHNLNGHGARV